MIFVGAAVFTTIALALRQSLLVAYILLGVVVRYLGMDYVADKEFVHYSGDIGIIFLLFLLGLHLDPIRLVEQMKRVSRTGVLSSVAFFMMGMGVMKAMGYSLSASIFVGFASMFSSTIIGLKLMPSQMMLPGAIGEVMISILLLQDFLAMIVLFLLHQMAEPHMSWISLGILSILLPIILVVSFRVVDMVIEPLMSKHQRIREYLFLLAIAWGLGLAVMAEGIGISYEIGAFIAGISLAHLRLANYLSETLMPLRDFFLVIFFFAVGMNISPDVVPRIVVPAFILASITLVVKILIYRGLLMRQGLVEEQSIELGYRLGQGSEFTILMTEVAKNFKFITPAISNLMELSTLITFLVSSFLVVRYYRTPIKRSTTTLDDD